MREPTTKEEIEVFLKEKIESDEAITGLYDCGLAFVLVDRAGGKLTFQWHNQAISFDEML